MSEWWTFGLSDFLMFSSRSYERLLLAHGAARWPLQPVAAAGALALGALAASGRLSARWLLAALALAWAAVAADFLATRYALIHLGARPMAWACGLQALGLAVAAAGGRVAAPSARSLLPAAVALLAYPAITAVSGRPPGTEEWAGFTPDPTAVLTLALLPATLPSRRAALLWALPAAILAVGAATLHLLRWPDAWWAAVAGVTFPLAAWAWRPTRCHRLPTGGHARH